MQDGNWLFDVVMDLCEKAEQLGFPEMSAKLEEALDVYLAENGTVAKSSVKAEDAILSFGPIALAQETFMFGHRSPDVAKDTATVTPVQKPEPTPAVEPKAAPVAAPAAKAAPVPKAAPAAQVAPETPVEKQDDTLRPASTSAVLQQLKAIRAKRTAEQRDKDDAEASDWLDKAG